MPVQTAIFDFDGTIADTFAAVVRALNSLADEFGYRVAQPAEIEQLRALPPREVAARLGVAWHKIPMIVTRARKELVRSMPTIMPFDGIVEALETLRSGGMSIGLLTSNSRENVDLFLARHPIAFDFISTGSGLFSKHRRLAAVLRRRKLSNVETAYVGDEIRDIEAGRALGMRVVAVGWGYTAPQLLCAQEPDYVVNEPAELVRVLRV
jgi:phosphoglycolate phosphatase-like HAD superfamily hydrolase